MDWNNIGMKKKKKEKKEMKNYIPFMKNWLYEKSICVWSSNIKN